MSNWRSRGSGTNESLTRCSDASDAINPADFQRLELRCHALLSDVPLHDVWAIELPTAGPDAPSATCVLL